MSCGMHEGVHDPGEDGHSIVAHSRSATDLRGLFSRCMDILKNGSVFFSFGRDIIMIALKREEK